MMSLEVTGLSGLSMEATDDKGMSTKATEVVSDMGNSTKAREAAVLKPGHVYKDSGASTHILQASLHIIKESF